MRPDKRIDPNREFQIFNTTISENGFYLHLQEQGNAKLGYDDIESVWRYMYNRMIDELTKVGVMDDFSRMKFDYITTVEKLQAYYGYPKNSNQTLAEILYQAMIEGGNAVYPDWTKMYPASLMTVAFATFDNELRNCKSWYGFCRKRCKENFIELPMAWLVRDAISSQIYYDPFERHHGLQICYLNQFGNRVALEINSNTTRMDDIMNDIAGDFNMISNIDIIMGQSQELKPAHKIMCTITIKSERRRTDDYPDA